MHLHSPCEVSARIHNATFAESPTPDKCVVRFLPSNLAAAFMESLDDLFRIIKRLDRIFENFIKNIRLVIPLRNRSREISSFSSVCNSLANSTFNSLIPPVRCALRITIAASACIAVLAMSFTNSHSGRIFQHKSCHAPFNRSHILKRLLIVTQY